MFERFTSSARSAVKGAVEIAEGDRAAGAGPEHLVLAILRQEGGTGAGILARHGVTEGDVRASVAEARRRGGLSTADAEALTGLGIDVDAVVAAVEQSHGEGALGGAGGHRRGPGRRWGSNLAPDARSVLVRCLAEVVERGERAIGDEHLLLAVLHVGGPAADALVGAGVTREAIRSALARA